MGHTPGPWRVEEARDTLEREEVVVWQVQATDPSCRVHAEGRKRSTCTCPAVIDVICECGWCDAPGDDFPIIRNQADARLIAAAPDLLAALKAVVAMGYEGAEPMTGWVQVHNAIAKAGGHE